MAISSGLKILGLEVESIKRVKAIRIEPTGLVVPITGKNKQGKTSLLDSIWWALEGAKHIQTKPIRAGADEGHIRLDLGAEGVVELVVKRTFASKEDGGFTTKVIVETADGARFPKPQEVLDGLVGALSLDPVAFTTMPADKQVKVLAEFFPGVDFEGAKKANKQDYEDRRIINRDLKSLRGQLDGLVVPESPGEPIDEDGLAKELEEVGKFNASITQQEAEAVRWKEAVAQRRREAEEHKLRAKALAEQAYRLKSEAAEEERRWDEAQSSAAAMEKNGQTVIEARKDPAEVRQRLTDARAHNARASAAQRAAESQKALEAAIADKETKVAGITQHMVDREAAIAKAVGAGVLPVEGLTFTFGADGEDEGRVLLNGIPFDQASDAEQLRTSVAIAAALSPRLRVIRVRDGSRFDSEGRKMLEEFALEHDMQIWLEVVTDGGPGGFVIEDGELKA